MSRSKGVLLSGVQPDVTHSVCVDVQLSVYKLVWPRVHVRFSESPIPPSL